MMNKNKNTVKIRVRDSFSESISSRDAIAMLFNRSFSPEQTIIIDFTNVAFITRSASHQLLKEVQRIEERFNCKVEIISTSSEVSNMIDVVRKSINVSKPAKKEVKQVYFESPSELTNFLMQF